MPIYKYKAIDEKGRSIFGRIDAVNDADLESRLIPMKLELISFQEARAGNGLGISFGSKVTRRDLITFCIHMEQLTRAGIPILDALGDLCEGMDNARFREIVSAQITAIEGGKTFSEALAESPNTFDRVFVNLVKAGEHSGELSEVLKRMSESLKWQDELAAHTKKLVMYPAFVGSVVIGVVFFLMIYLVPQMVDFIENMGNELPLHTQLLIVVSDFLIGYWYVVLITPIALFFTIRYLAQVNHRVKFALDGLKLRIWFVGPILRKIILSRFASYFALLYASGITVLSAVKISEEIVDNVVIEDALHRIGAGIADGKSMSESIENVGLFPTLVLRMLKVGENTGAIDEALLNVSYFYNRDVSESIDRLQSMIEPVMTVVLGLILGWVMLSVLGPIYDLISTIR